MYNNRKDDKVCHGGVMRDNITAGTDKLICSLNDFKIGQNAHIQLKQGDIDTATGEIRGNNLLFVRNKSEYRGKSAYLNDEQFNVDILPDKRELIMLGSGNNINSVMNVTFSPAKIIGKGNNLNEVSQSEMGQVLNHVQKQLKSNDIHCNIFEATPIRIDLFKNVFTDEPIPTYAPIFNVLNGRRVKNKTTYDATGFLMQNTVMQYAMYDKIEEMNKRKVDTSTYKGNIARFEQRFMDKRKIAKATGLGSVRDILKRYRELPELFENGWKSEVFKYEGKDILIKYAKQIEDELRYFMFDENGNIRRNWQQRHLQMKGLQYIAETEGRDVYRIALNNVLSEQYEKQNTINVKIRRAMDKLDEVKTDLEMLKKTKLPDKTILTLYNELKSKLFKKVA